MLHKSLPDNLPRIIRVGTRGSKLALAQAEEAKARLLTAWPQLTEEAYQIEIVPMMTSGDQIQDKNLAEIGGKGLFTKEIEDALLSGHVHLAVHSMKDMPAAFPKGLVVDCLLPREDVRDAFVSVHHKSLSSLPAGSIVGTSSTRRAAQLKARFPSMEIIPFRGNVQTRLTKLEQGQVAATFLAVAGLKRLGLEHHITEKLEPETMLPAVAQGAIGVERLEANIAIGQLLAAIHDENTAVTVGAERAFLSALGGSCVTPMAAHATLLGEGKLYLTARLFSHDGKTIHHTERTGALEDVVLLGFDAGEEIKKKDGGKILKYTH